MKHTLVLPNLASFRSRGKLAQRWSVAEELGCEVVEIPADLVKSATEAERTGQPIGDILTKGSVEDLYGNPFPGGRSILHTDPGIPRRDRRGEMVIPQLRWDDQEWSRRYAGSVCWTIGTMGGRVEGVEVHPGNERGSIERLAVGFRAFGDALADAEGDGPVVMVENKHRHRVDSVPSMTEIMELLPGDRFGLVVDVSNLWKTYRRRISEAMEQLPWGRIRAVHLHLRHHAPAIGDSVDWSQLFDLIDRRAGRLYINPEVFHRRELEKALALIKEKIS